MPAADATAARQARVVPQPPHLLADGAAELEGAPPGVLLLACLAHGSSVASGSLGWAPGAGGWCGAWSSFLTRSQAFGAQQPPTRPRKAPHAANLTVRQDSAANWGGPGASGRKP
jgi:hypothetical protein